MKKTVNLGGSEEALRKGLAAGRLEETDFAQGDF